MSGRKSRLTGLAAWIERNIRLPDTVADPGPVKLWPWQREIADAIADPSIERVSLLKAARLGFSSLLTSAIGYYCVEKPSPILYLLPTEADCRGFIVDDVEPLFDASPILRRRLATPSLARRDRNTMLHRLWPGGSLKCVAGKAPRNLRRHTARILMIDEADAIEVSAEGDPIGLAERRTMTYPDRKIIVGGTPIDAETSHVLRCYLESDQRVFEVPCPACGAFTEILWRHIEWPEGRPELAGFRCPHCAELVTERHKREMVFKGRWRATAPGALGYPSPAPENAQDMPEPGPGGGKWHSTGGGHAGFRINALVSLLPSCAWPVLAAEWLRCHGDDDRLKVFTNTLLGEAWREAADEVDEAELQGRCEGFDLDHIPGDVLALTVGCDLADDRAELTIAGHARDGTVYVLAHVTLWGSPTADEDLWSEIEALLRQRWRHPSGGVLKIDAAVIDGGDGAHMDAVMKFCGPRLGRRVLAGKGVAGFGRPMIQASKTKRGRLFIVGSDVLKTQILTRLSRGRSIRFSHTLTATYFEQLASERRVVRMARGRPVARFERKPGAKAEALDALAYALAAKAAITLSEAAFNQREDALRSPVPSGKPEDTRPAVIRSKFMERQRRGFGDGWQG